jgi:uronate dehydrogenase
MTRRVLITGAGGVLGTVVRNKLAGGPYRLRYCDIRAFDGASDDDVVIGDLGDPDVAVAATRDIDCIVHLAGIPREGAWEPILRNNIDAMQVLFEAAVRNGVRRVVFASSNHVTGFYPVDIAVDPSMPVRPDGFYAASKVFGEALGRLYSDRHGIEVACLRIGAFRPKPENRRQLAIWLSPGDLVSLVERCIGAEAFSFLTIYAVSANSRSMWSDTDRQVIGWTPRDNAEAFAQELEDDGAPPFRYHGGVNCEPH